jgi:PAS domain S-box-containing protein
MGPIKDPPGDSELRRRAEGKLKKTARGKDELSEVSSEKMAAIVHELQVHQTELKMQNEELRRSQGDLETARDRYSHLYDFAPVGYLTVSEEGIITEANLTIASLLGIERSALVGKPFSRFILREDQGIFYEQRQQLLATETPQFRELRLIQKDGHEFYARLDCTVIKTEGDDLRQIRAAVSDISAHKKVAALEEKIRVDRTEQLSRLALQLTLAEERERRRIADILHDDLQQLLVAAKMNLENLAAHMHTVKRQDIQQVHELVMEMIRKSRILTAELAPPLLNHDCLVPALEWLADFVRQTHGLSVELQLDPDVAIFREDFKMLLFRCVRELLLNAVKHAGVSSVRISMSRDDQNNVRIAVTDQGAGFDPGRLGENKNQKVGFGLLSIRERLAVLGGCLEVDSAPGKGTTCTLVAPLPKDERNRIEEPILPEKCVSILPARGPGQKISVLLADDHAVVREGLSSLLTSYPDIEIVGEAADGEQAVDLARALRPEVILIDINMPKMDGIEATRIISLELPGTRIIGLSMYADEGIRSSMLAAGVAAYVKKDSDSEMLLAAIRDRGAAK